VDGRFDMIATLLSLVLIRLEREGDATRTECTLLTEAFIADMDGNIRQLGTGDVVVGKHIGKMVGALGGRLGSFRQALEAGEGLEGPVRRNVFHDTPPSDGAVGAVAARMKSFHDGLGALHTQDILRGSLPGV
jgi:cytochrome b pre-mRNA-processing protein 3